MKNETHEALEALSFMREYAASSGRFQDKLHDRFEAAYDKLSAALQAQAEPSEVDVEGLKRRCVSTLVKNEQEHIKAQALQKYSSFIKMKGEFEYFVRLVVDHLHAQGHLTAPVNPAKCLMGDDCDLTIAYMKGYAEGKDSRTAPVVPEIVGLNEALIVADYDARDVCGMELANRAYDAKIAYRKKFNQAYGYTIEKAAKAYASLAAPQPPEGNDEY